MKSKPKKHFDFSEAVRHLLSGKKVTRDGYMNWYWVQDGKIFGSDGIATKQYEDISVDVHELLSKDWTVVDEGYEAIAVHLHCTSNEIEMLC